MRATQNIEDKSSIPNSKEQKRRSTLKRRDGNIDRSVDALLHVDDEEYIHSMRRSTNCATKDQNSQFFKRHMIPALPSRHGSRADSVVPLYSQHSPARLRAEKILSRTHEFHALFEDNDLSILDQSNDFEVRVRNDAKKQESLSHSMAMSVWRAKKINSVPQSHTKTLHSDKFQANASSNSALHRFSHSESPNLFHRDDLSERSNTVKDGSFHANFKVAQDPSTQAKTKSMHISKLRQRNDQISDDVLQVAIMNDIVEGMVKQQHANPYVSLLDIKFAADAGTDGASMSNPKVLAKMGAQESKMMVDELGRKKYNCKPAKRSKVVKSLQESDDRKKSPIVTDTANNDICFHSESPGETHFWNSPGPVESQMIRESTTLPPLQHKARTVEVQKLLHDPSMHPKTFELKLQQQCFSKNDFELIGFTINSEENIERMVSRSVLFEAIERNADERNELCFDINRCCLKLQKQWQAKQNTMLLCQSNTRLQGSARSRLLAILRSLQRNQDDFFALAQQCHVFGSGSSGMSRKITNWKQEIGNHMHELVKLPTVADVLNEIATEVGGRSNGFKSAIGTFSGCAKADLATAAACSKMLLGSKDSKIQQQNDAKFFRIFGNNVAPSNGQMSSMMLSPSEPQEEYNKV